MAMIEGIGDEVIWCLIAVAVISVLILAWVSTDVAFNRTPGSVWLVQMQTFPHRRILQIFSLDSNPLHAGSSQSTGSTDGNGEVADSIGSESGEGTSDGTTNNLDISLPEASESDPPSSDPASNSSTPAGTDSVDELGSHIGTTDSDHQPLIAANASPGDDQLQNQTDTSRITVRSPTDDTGQTAFTAGALSQIRLKFLDETLRLVDVELSQTVGEFKRSNFPDEVRLGKIIRLIFNGQLLRDDSRSLASYGLFSECVVHCHVSNTPLAGQPGPGSSGSLATGPLQHSTVHYVNGGATRLEFLQAGPMGFPASTGIGGQSHHHHHHAHIPTAGLHEGSILNLGQHVYLIFGIKFALLWSAWFVYPEYFDFTALFTLFLCSVVYGGFVYASRRRSQMTAERESPGLHGASSTGTATTAATAGVGTGNGNVTSDS